MTVVQLLQDMDTDFVIETMTDFHEDTPSFLEDIHTLIDEQSWSLKEFMHIIAAQQGVEAVMGATVALTFLHRRAETEEATRAWLHEGLLSRPDRFFLRQAMALVMAFNEFQERAQDTIDKNAMPFKGFLAGAAESYGVLFAVGATTMVELLLRSEEYDQLSLN